MSTVTIELTDKNIKKLLNHEPTLIKYSQLISKTPTHQIMLKPRKHKKVQTSIRKNKGLVLSLEPDEIAGSGIIDNLKKLHRDAKPFLRRTVRRIAKEGANTLVDTASNFVPGGKMIAPYAHNLVNKYSDQLVNKVGDLTGAYGLPQQQYHKQTWGGSFRPAGY